MAANEKKPTIVIKKITVVSGGHHGGSWKVAFADFMTAMMAFFLVMWLVGQSEDVKKSVADYFSTPSIIEYNFSNYGVELTLEKLFLDLVNQPLKAFEQFIKPVDRMPNVMDMGHKKIQFEFLRNRLGEFNVQVEALTDEITFEIPTNMIYQAGSARPSAQFVPVMEKVREIIQGLKDSDIYFNVEEPVLRGESETLKKNLAEARLDMMNQKIEASIQGDNVDIFGKITVEPLGFRSSDKRGYVKFRIKKKQFDGTDGNQAMRQRKPDNAKEVSTRAVIDGDSFNKAVEDRFKKSRPYSDFVDSDSDSGKR
jgi:chemotaxis protein MotB